MTKKEQPKTCKTCEHFKCGQRELNYWEGAGFCTNGKFRFNTIVGRLIGVYDKENAKDNQRITGNTSHDIETMSEGPFKINESRYIEK